MRKLSVEQKKRRDDIAGMLAVSQVELEQALAKHKAKIVEAQTFCAEVAGEIDSYITDKSEKWQEGETGQAFSEWKDSWENIEFDDPPELEGVASEILLALDEEPNT